MKFERRYLFTEFHWDTGPPYGTANPLECIKNCPIEDLSEGRIGKAAKRYFDNEALFQWINEQAAKLGIKAESG